MMQSFFYFEFVFVNVLPSPNTPGFMTFFGSMLDSTLYYFRILANIFQPKKSKQFTSAAGDTKTINESLHMLQFFPVANTLK